MHLIIIGFGNTLICFKSHALMNIFSPASLQILRLSLEVEGSSFLVRFVSFVCFVFLFVLVLILTFSENSKRKDQTFFLT